MEQAVDRAWKRAQAPAHISQAAASVVSGSFEAAFEAEIALAARAIERDPDVAAIALDGLLWRMLEAWYAARGMALPARAALLADLERRAPALAWRMRLALRAPDVAARLAHCRHILGALALEGSERAEHQQRRRPIPFERQSQPKSAQSSPRSQESMREKGSAHHVR